MEKTGGKAYDLNAAFLSVNRKKIWDTMKGRRIKAGLIERIREISTTKRRAD